MIAASKPGIAVGDMRLCGAFGSRRVIAFDTERGVVDMQGLRLRDDMLVEVVWPADPQKPTDPEGQAPSDDQPPYLMGAGEWQRSVSGMFFAAPVRCWGPKRTRLYLAWWKDRRTLETPPAMKDAEFVTDGTVWQAVDGTAGFRDLTELKRQGWRPTKEEAVAVVEPWARDQVDTAAAWLVALEALAPKKPARLRVPSLRKGGGR